MNATEPRTAEAICLVDRDGRIVAADAAASAWAIVDRPDATWLSDVIGAELAAVAMERIIGGASEVAFDAMLCVGAPTDESIHIRIRRLKGNGGPMALVAFQRGAAALALDELTRLPDRRAIADRVAQWRSAGGGSTPRFAVLFLDLDGFKRINDEHGHAAGDQVLTAIARRLAGCVRDEDLVVRYGGDEFVLLLKDVAFMDYVDPVLERLDGCVRQTVEVGDRRFRVGATIGVAISDGTEQPLEALLAAADRDMYARKRRRPK